MNKQKFIEYKLNEIDVDRQIKLRKHGVWSRQEDQLFKAVEAVVKITGYNLEINWNTKDAEHVLDAILEQLDK